MDEHPGHQFPYDALFWPVAAAASAGSMAAQFFGRAPDVEIEAGRQEPQPATPSRLALDLHAVRLRDFSRIDRGIPTLLCTPLALHGAVVADLVGGHSLVAALLGAGSDRLLMVDWRSASADMRFLAIDDYLAELNVLVDHVGGLVDLVGLCQGGWLSLLYAGRFPAKVRKLVMAGAPVDTAARPSVLSTLASATPFAVFQNLVDQGGGRVIGRDVAPFWGQDMDADHLRETLQTQAPVGSTEFARLERIFNIWNSWYIDVPGRYYLEVIDRFYKRNELASGHFVALGQTIELSRLRHPIFLLAGGADQVTTPDQLLAVQRLVGTPPQDIQHEIAPCNHLGLFMGRQTLQQNWPRIVRWMQQRSD